MDEHEKFVLLLEGQYRRLQLEENFTVMNGAGVISLAFILTSVETVDVGHIFNIQFHVHEKCKHLQGLQSNESV